MVVEDPRSRENLGGKCSWAGASWSAVTDTAGSCGDPRSPCAAKAKMDAKGLQYPSNLDMDCNFGRRIRAGEGALRAPVPGAFAELCYSGFLTTFDKLARLPHRDRMLLGFLASLSAPPGPLALRPKP